MDVYTSFNYCTFGPKTHTLRPFESNCFFLYYGDFYVTMMFVCVQELYSGGKDCNLLAWVPVVRTADVEEESSRENKVQPAKKPEISPR